LAIVRKELDAPAAPAVHPANGAIQEGARNDTLASLAGTMRRSLPPGARPWNCSLHLLALSPLRMSRNPSRPPAPTTAWPHHFPTAPMGYTRTIRGVPLRPAQQAILPLDPAQPGDVPSANTQKPIVAAVARHGWFNSGSAERTRKRSCV
jgi:hypothetical protein